MNPKLLALGGCLALLVVATSGRPADVAKPTFPPKVSDDKRHLTDAAGRPFLVVGDTAWSLIVQLRDADVRHYLDDRKKRGFNSVIVNLLEHKFATKAPATLDGVPPFEKAGDFTRPNAAYFDRAHRVVAEANKRGLAVWLCPAYLGWAGNDEGFFKEVKAAGPKALRAYGKYVGERFADLPNIVWMPGGDYAVPKDYRWAGEEVALGLIDGGAKQLMTAHGGQTSAVETFGDRPWLAIDNVYRYQDDLWKPLRAGWAKSPTRPYVLIETTYEGEHKATPAQVRRQAWWAMTCGACGQFFGNNPIWYFDGPGYTHMKSADSWRKALDLTGSRDMARLAAFFKGRPWHRLVPDVDDKLVAAGGGATKATAARTADGKLAVVYVASDGKKPRVLTLNLGGFGGPVAGRWFNPAKDQPLVALAADLKNRDGQPVTTPGDNGTGANDWVLVLEVR